ncbi:swr1 complex component [Coemansia sp. RSA 1722]|nr:swr1 complex component [Coemansia sp. RSA 486]KAJ2228800.1 swr1 complex component [Coemansia sp. RSA 485]KAJ2596090.1 swr1 complex component [Coemansia sp. RSA 1722]
MNGLNDGHSVRGRRRGRPPGVRSSRSTAKGTAERMQRTAVSKAGRRSRKESSSDTSSGSEDEDLQENKGSVRSAKRPKTDRPSVRGRGRGRRGLAQRTPTTRARQSAVSINNDSQNNTRASTPTPITATATALPVHTVIDPRIFACKKTAEYRKCGRELTEYLQAFTTLPDDRVVSSLPKHAASKRKAGSMTIPSAAAISSTQVSSRVREKALAEEKAARKIQMKSDFDLWVHETAHTMHRISVLRRQGMLRDSEPEDDPGCSPAHSIGRILPPAQELPCDVAAEPRRPKTTWDQLLSDITNRHREMGVEMRKQRTILRKRVRLIERNEEERQAQLGIYRDPVAAERAERENSRKLAKWTMQQVMRKWTYVESVVQEQREAEEQEAREREGKQALFDMVERSTRLLAEQRQVESGSESSSDSHSDSGSGSEAESDLESEKSARGTRIAAGSSSTGNGQESEDDSDEAGSSDSEMDALERDQEVPMEELLEQYRQMHMVVASPAATEEATVTGSASPEPESPEPAEPAFTAKAVDNSQPALLRGQLREYQRQGVDWLVALHRQQTNGILADEMGLGKTIQTIAFLAHLACNQGIWGPHLVVVPTSVLLNWEQEFHKWLPGFKVLAYYGSRSERKLKRRGWSHANAFHVCITSYQLAIQDAAVLKRRPWHCMVLDEAQAIKNFRSQRWQTLLGFRTASRLLLTGTPLQNSLLELWSLMYFLMPRELGAADGADGNDPAFAGLDRFREWFAQPLDRLLAAQPDIAAPDHAGAALNTAEFLQGAGAEHGDAQQAVRKLHAVLRPHILRRLKHDVETQLPNKTEHVIYCSLSKRQRFLYDDFMARSQTRATLQAGSYLGVMGCLMQLRKVCNHPDLFETRPIVTSWVFPGDAVADYGHRERLVRRMLAEPSRKHNLRKPWGAAGGRASGAVRGLLVAVDQQRKDAMASLSARRLDATPLLLRRGLQCARSALLDIEASEERCWNELQMRPAATTRYFSTSIAEGAAREQKRTRIRRQDAWMRLAKQNIERMHRPAHTPIYGAGTLDACRVVSHVFDRLRTAGLVLSTAERMDRSLDLIERFVFATPPVVVANSGSALEAVHPHLRTTQPNGITDQWARELQPTILHMRRRVHHHTGLMRPLEVRQQIAFPEPFLLQYDCGKLQALDRLLSRLVRDGHRVLLFTQMTRVLDILEKWLNLHRYRYLRLDGATKVEQRHRLTERFNHDPRWSVFISSTRAGGLGINLTGADTVIFYDSDWNHAMDAQCQDRCHRIGQQREVNIYRLISERTVEEAIWRKQCEKRWLNQVVIQEGNFGIGDGQQPTHNVSSVSGHGAMVVGDWYDLAGSMLAESGEYQRPGTTTGAAPAAVVSERDAARMLNAVEDDEADAAALRVAISEVAQADALDMGEDPQAQTHKDPGQSEPGAAKALVDEADSSDDGIGHVDDYMARFVASILFGEINDLPASA